MGITKFIQPRYSTFLKRFFLILVVLLAIVITFGIAITQFGELFETKLPMEYQEWIEEYSAEFDVDPALISAVIKTESDFDPLAESSIGARGLMQITSDTFDWAKARLGEKHAEDTYDQLFEPEQNILYGCYLLSAFIEEFGSENNALYAYHAGWGNAKNWLKNPEYAPDGTAIVNSPFRDSNWYVHTVMERKQQYHAQYFCDDHALF